MLVTLAVVDGILAIANFVLYRVTNETKSVVMGSCCLVAMFACAFLATRA